MDRVDAELSDESEEEVPECLVLEIENSDEISFSTSQNRSS